MSRFHRPSVGRFSRSAAGRRGARTTSVLTSGDADLCLHQWVEEIGVVVGVTGDLDGEIAQRLLSMLTSHLADNRSVCCDLSAVGYFGAAGANILAIAHLKAAGTRGHFCVRGVRGATALVLEATGLGNVLTVIP
jgi:anti-anti-sigma factor